MNPKNYSATTKEKRRIRQKNYRARLRGEEGAIKQTYLESEERHVNCPNEEISLRIKLASKLKAQYGGLIPEEEFDKYFPNC